MKRYSGLLIILLLLQTILCQAQRGSVQGQVKDQDKTPFIGATVRLLGINNGTTTDERGFYQLSNIPRGKYTLEITYIGYQTQQAEVTIKANETTRLNLQLTENTTQLDDIVVQGQSISEELSQQAIQMTSIDLKELQSESSDVITVLDRAAGVRVRQSGGLGSEATIQLNGLTGRAVRLYYDGIPLELIGRGIQLNNFPVNNIERVDVYKGVMPIDIGTDALAGGVNLVPRKSYQSFLDASYQLGSFNTHIATLNAAKHWKNGYFLELSAFFNYSDNDYKMTVQNLIPEEFREETIRVRRFHNRHQSSMIQAKIGAYGRKWADEFTFAIGFNQREDEVQHGVIVGNTPSGEANRDDQVWLQHLRYKKQFLDERLFLDYFGSFSYAENAVDDSTRNLYNWRGEINPNVPLGRGSEIVGLPSLREGENISTAHRLTLTYKLRDNHHLKVNNYYAYQKIEGNDPVGIRIGGVDPNTIPSSLDRNILGMSYDGKFFKENLDVILFGKYYYYNNKSFERSAEQIFDLSADGNKIGYGLGLKYSFSPNFFIRGSFEKAIRIPDDFEFFGDFITIESNLNLRPEESDNLNLGAYYRYQFGQDKSIAVDFNFFLRNQTDLVRLLPGRNENDPAQYINEEEVDARGVELVIQSQVIKNLTLDFNFTYQDIKKGGEKDVNNIEAVGRPIPNIPTLFFNLAARYTLESPFKEEDRFTIFSYFNFVDEFSTRLEASNSNSQNFVPLQTQLNAGASYTFTSLNLSLSVQVNNITNNEVFDNFRVPKPGINTNFKLRYFIQ